MDDFEEDGGGAGGRVHGESEMLQILVAGEFYDCGAFLWEFDFLLPTEEVHVKWSRYCSQ
jgi:hypothetical protein